MHLVLLIIVDDGKAYDKDTLGGHGSTTSEMSERILTQQSQR
jgi:hypothetical protein